jgi:hypothetical protein
MVRETDNTVELFYLHDRIFNWLSRGLIDDLEDPLERHAVCFGAAPPGQFAGDFVHCLNASVCVTGYNRIANGLKRSAQFLFGAKDLLRPGTQDVVRAAVGGRYILQQAAGIKPDDQTKNYRNKD